MSDHDHATSEPPPPPPGAPGGPGAQPWPGYAYPPPPAQAGTNGFAIASLVLGLIAAFPLGIIFGIVALAQIKRSGQQGKGLAIAGIVLSVVWLILIVAGVGLFLANRPQRGDDGSITRGGDVLVHDLEVGDCMNGLQEAEVVVTVDAVACSQPHDAELYATIEVADGDWPGVEELSLEAQQRCSDEMAENFEAAYEDDSVELFFLHPTSASWREGDREIDCIALYSEPRTGALN